MGQIFDLRTFLSVAWLVLLVVFNDVAARFLLMQPIFILFQDLKVP